MDILYRHHWCNENKSGRDHWFNSGWPAPEALDYQVACEVCGEVVDAIPLTDYGWRELHEAEDRIDGTVR